MAEGQQEQKQTLDPNKYANVAVDQTEVPVDVPEQGGNYVPMLPFGKYALRLPSTLAQCLELKEVNVDGTPVPRVFYRCTRDNALVVVGGPENDHPINYTFNNINRTTRKGDNIPSKLYFLLREGFKDMREIKKLADWWTYMNAKAGQVFNAEIGGQAQCRDDKVRYITMAVEGGAEETVEDPSGIFGCGERYYTRDIPKDANGKAVERFRCACGASLRVFNEVDRILPPK